MGVLRPEFTPGVLVTVLPSFITAATTAMALILFDAPTWGWLGIAMVVFLLMVNGHDEGSD